MKDYTLEGMLPELARIMKIRPLNGETMATELSERKRTILETLGQCA